MSKTGDRYLFTPNKENSVTSVANFCKRPVCVKVADNEIWCDLADFSLVRAIFLDPDETLELRLFHEPLDGLVVDGISAVSHLRCNPTVTIPSAVFIEDGCNLCTLYTPLVRLLSSIIIECRPRHPLNLQKKIKFVITP